MGEMILSFWEGLIFRGRNVSFGEGPNLTIDTDSLFKHPPLKNPFKLKLRIPSRYLWLWNKNCSFLGGGFKYFLFSTLLGEMIQFDEPYFSNRLKPPTRNRSFEMKYEETIQRVSPKKTTPPGLQDQRGNGRRAEEWHSWQRLWGGKKSSDWTEIRRLRYINEQWVDVYICVYIYTYCIYIYIYTQNQNG